MSVIIIMAAVITCVIIQSVLTTAAVDMDGNSIRTTEHVVVLTYVFSY